MACGILTSKREMTNFNKKSKLQLDEIPLLCWFIRSQTPTPAKSKPSFKTLLLGIASHDFGVLNCSHVGVGPLF